MNPNTIGYILTESSVNSETQVIGDDKGGRLFAEGIMQDLDVVNRNQRIYLPEDIDPDLNSARIQNELIPTGNMKGEANHPLDKSLARQQVVDLERTAVVYHKLWREGNIIKGQFCGTNNNFGDYFNRDLAAGYKPSFSLRALGSIENQGGKAYVKNIRIITYDWVILPSHQVAYTQKLIDRPTTGVSTMIATPSPQPTTESTMPESLREGASLLTESTIPILNDQILGFVKSESNSIKSVLENFDLQYASAQLINEGASVAMTDALGTTFVVNIEDHIKNQFMDYLV